MVFGLITQYINTFGRGTMEGLVILIEFSIA